MDNVRRPPTSALSEAQSRSERVGVRHGRCPQAAAPAEAATVMITMQPTIATDRRLARRPIRLTVLGTPRRFLGHPKLRGGCVWP